MNIDYIKLKLNEIADYKRIDEYNKYFDKEEILHFLKRADELQQNIFTFNKTWDMERCKTPYKLENLDWNIYNNDDEEWCFMLNRMDYINDLAISYLYTSDLKYIDKAKYFILDWIDKHKILKKELSTRTLDTAIRLFNWTLSLIVMQKNNLISDEELKIICESILNQSEFLKDNYLKKYKTSNWGSIQTTVLVSILPIFIEDYKNFSLYNWAYDELELQFCIQSYEDGMFWEQSTMYQVEVLNYGMIAMYHHNYFNDKNEKWFKVVEKFANSLFYQLTPTFEIEAFGDSDRVLASDVFNRACVLFNNNEYKYVTNCYDIESLYIFGMDFLNKYNEMEKIKPKQNNYYGNDSGMYVIKSGWDKEDSFTMYTNGSLGSGHGHSDNLHISICYKGEFMLIDTGRYTYREDHHMRVHLKSAFAHNIVVLNNKPFCVPESSWTYENFGIVLKNYVNSKEDFHYLEGGIIGNNPLQVIIRKVVIINPNIWLIVDEIKADGQNTAKLNFHIDPYKNVIENNEEVHILGNKGTLKLVQNVKADINNSKCSLFYNELLENKVVSYEKSFKDELNFITCICDKNIEVEEVDLYQGDKLMPKEFGQARKFKISDTESYTIAVYHKEIYQGQKVLFCEGMAFHSKCVIIYEKDGYKTLTVMKA